MKPVKKSYRVEYWDCGLGHRHTSRAIADKCIAKIERNPGIAVPVDKEAVVADAKAGMPRKDLAAKHGRSVQRIAQIVYDAEYAEQQETSKRRLQEYQKLSSGKRWRLDAREDLSWPVVVTVVTPKEAGRQAYWQTVIPGGLPDRPTLARAIRKAREEARLLRLARSLA